MTDVGDLILLPGMMCDARLFAPQIAVLQDSMRISVPLPVSAPNMAQLAAEVLADAPDRFALGGVSMGGILAMEIIRQAAQRVTHLALIDTNPFAERDEVKARRTSQMDAVRDGRLAAVMRDEMKPSYFTHRGENADLLDLTMAMATDLGPDAFIAQSLALRDRPDYEATLRHVTCSTLILCGRHDQLCPVERHEAMKAMIPHARLCIVEEAGHLPTIETPGIVTTALQELLETHHG